MNAHRLIGSVARSPLFRAAVLLGLAIAAIMWQGGGQDPEDVAKMRHGHSLVFLALGDSYTMGEGIEPENSWPAQLARRLRESWVDVDDPRIIAQIKWTSLDLRDAVIRENLQGPYDMVTLMTGVNDHFRSLSLEDLRHNLHKLLDVSTRLVGGDPKKIIIVSIPDWTMTTMGRFFSHDVLTPPVERYNAILQSEARRAGAHYVDITALSRDPVIGAGISPDGLHPNAEQYAAWTNALLPSALEILR